LHIVSILAKAPIEVKFPCGRIVVSSLAPLLPAEGFDRFGSGVTHLLAKCKLLTSTSLIGLPELREFKCNENPNTVAMTSDLPTGVFDSNLELVEV
jgi:hypothetical protein